MTQRAKDGDYIYFVSANVQDRQWFFTTIETAETLGQAIVMNLPHWYGKPPFVHINQAAIDRVFLN